jgi:branched-chain amino acid aminotransferase
LNGNWIPASLAAVSAADAGFVLGAAVSDQIRTFCGAIFRLQDHLDRLERCLRLVDLDSGLKRDQWAAIAQKLIEKNRHLLAPGDDWGLSIFVTPGIYRTFSAGGDVQPTVCMHLYPLPFHLWADKYGDGQTLATTPIRQVPCQCWPPELKCRSRMHYYLADKAAAKQHPGARALLLDQDGHVTETSTANILAYTETTGLISPPQDKILHGISLAVTFEIAGKLGISRTYRDLTIEDLAAADEVLITSTPMCLLPVTALNGRPIGGGRPGEIFRMLLRAWSDTAGLDIVAQAKAFANRAV